MVLKKWEIFYKFRLPEGLVVVALLAVAAVYLNRDISYWKVVKKNLTAVKEEQTVKCDLSTGRWVYDNVSYPLYKEDECSLGENFFACERFNAIALLEKLRNKRLVFVGDSLNRVQWISMVCLIGKAIPGGPESRVHNDGSSLLTFTVKEYNAKIDFYWAPLMVESNSDDIANHRVVDRTVKVEAIEKHGRHWADADFLVFNSYLWWRQLPKMEVLWGAFNSSDGIYKQVDMQRSYEMALRTWADWLEFHVNRSKAQLFFMSMSPIHEKAEKWGKPAGQNCHMETHLITKEGYIGNEETDTNMMTTVEKTIDGLQKRGLKIQMLNITKLSEYRKDGHPSIFRKQWEPLTESQISNPKSYADCIHWCLPGVPDTWNELLYAYIVDDVLHVEKVN
ncbi:Protein trichome birefringence-like 34 [Striga hermonthica]|uniref:Protein trichome birefringence-like 34 n=1 Tax=Striga hermonthica TaxID=68872 RepID=A0A9N7NUD1_STRHE|nr:Protein trichome birefringence-like 34 [Striga hermonthica]